jgi:hypothetical protein
MRKRCRPGLRVNPNDFFFMGKRGQRDGEDHRKHAQAPVNNEQWNPQILSNFDALVEQMKCNEALVLATSSLAPLVQK